MWVVTLQLVDVLPEELPLLEIESSQVDDLLNTSFGTVLINLAVS
jgi:hypothetical protein